MTVGLINILQHVQSILENNLGKQLYSSYVQHQQTKEKTPIRQKPKIIIYPIPNCIKYNIKYKNHA